MRTPHDLDTLAHAIDSAFHDPEVRYAGQGRSVAETLKEIRFHASARYWQFTPTYARDFESRLIEWLSNPGLDDAARGALLELVPELQFIDRDDMVTLYRVAYTQQISRWLMEQIGLDFALQERVLQREIASAMKQTWICPITDSMDIAQFCHVNDIRTTFSRPQWQTLRRFGAIQKVQTFLKTKTLKRVVLLEDFVGSGKQAGQVLTFAMEQLVPAHPVLFVPLTISVVGLASLRSACARYSQLTIEPVLTIPASVHVSEHPSVREPPFVEAVRSVIARNKRRFRHPYGFEGVGSLLVSYANCPNNAPQVLWGDAKRWKGLFPRVSKPIDWGRP